MSRISRLKERALRNGENPNCNRELNYLLYRGMIETPPEYSHHLRRARIDAFTFDHYTIEIDPEELLVGRFALERELTEEEKALEAAGRDFKKHAGVLSGTQVGLTGHRVIDYEKLLNVGIGGILREIDEHLAALDLSDPDCIEKEAFYTACKIDLEAVCRFGRRYHDTLSAMAAECTDPVRKKELEVMADNFARAPYEPCQHFYEALQCMWFVQFCLRIIEDITLTGRLDNYLYPFYKKDLESGYITREFAFELIESLYLKHNEIYDSWPASVMLGGVDRQGRSNWNDLTMMAIEAIETTGLVNPSVAVCYTEDMPDEILHKCVEMIAKGYTRPSIFNDRVIQEGLRCAGVSEEDSRYYVHSTCVEITPIAASNIQVATPYINLNKSFEHVFGNGQALFGDELQMENAPEVDLSKLTDFDSFYQLIQQTCRSIIRANLHRVMRTLYDFARYTSCPLTSCFLNDCLKDGKDSAAGGARYNYVYPCFPGFINLVDSLAAIRQMVYEEKLVTLEEMSNLLRSNYEGNERLRQYALNRCPKFGNGEDSVDALGVDMYNMLREELSHYRTPINGTFHSSYFAWIMHGLLGSRGAATPDGRRQAEALSECLGSVQGMDKNGPTGILRSIEKIDQKYGIGGIATNFRFTKKFMSDETGITAVMNFIKTFMEKNCFEIQFNVVDQQTLLDALEHPEQYRTLLVRVAGYSDYFVNLSPIIQNEIIRRSEHGEI